MNKQQMDHLFLEGCKHIGETDFFTNRGYDTAVLEKYRIGYLQEGLKPFRKWLDEDERILSCYRYVIPNINKKGEITYIQFRSDKQAVKEQLPFDIDGTYMIGPSQGKIWNDKALFSEKKTVYVVETWTDAMSLIQWGYDALALNRINHIVDLWKRLRDNRDFQTNKYIIACDDDYYGKKANSNLASMFASMNVDYEIFDDYPENVKDINEGFVSHPKELHKRLTGEQH